MTKVLVADDQPSMRGTLASMLRHEGFEVEEARDGNDASERISAECFDRLKQAERVSSQKE